MPKLSSRKKVIRVPQNGLGKVAGGAKTVVIQAGIGVFFVAIMPLGKQSHKEIGW